MKFSSLPGGTPQINPGEKMGSLDDYPISDPLSISMNAMSQYFLDALSIPSVSSGYFTKRTEAKENERDGYRDYELILNN
jgi:hypothetical protein